MKFPRIEYLLTALFACILVSCSSTKFVPDGEYLLDKVYIKSDNPEYKSVELKPYVKQIPNYKMFALNKTQLQIYNLSGRDSNKWINRQIRKIGEPPVIFDSTQVERTQREIEKFFKNKGYIHADITSLIERQGKKVEVTYSIISNEPHRIRNFSVDIPDTAIYNELYSDRFSPYRLPGEPVSAKTTLIKTNMLFDKNILDMERDRISNLLRNRGYYAFNKEYITYDADSTQEKNRVDLKLRIHLYPEILPNGMYVEVPHRRYFMDKVFIYTNYNPLSITGINQYWVHDSVKRGKYTIFYNEKRLSLRPKTLMDNNFLTPGRVYSQGREEITYSSYSSLQALNNTTIQFEEITRNDSSLLNTYILTMPAKKQGITYAIEGTNSAGDFGFASSVGYNHRNLFKGSEYFNVKVRGAYEAISENLQNYYLDLGAEASIRFPKFMFPFLSNSFKRRMRASTEFTTSYNYQTRPEYDRTLISGSLKYIWQNRGRTTFQHQFRLMDINYVYLPRIDSTFQANLPKNAIYFNYTNQFIVGMVYSFSHSTFNPLLKQRNVHSFRASAESAGNALYGGSVLFSASKDNNGYYKLFNTYYAQFVKGDIDYSKTISIDKQNSIAWRIGGGIGIPYGNSDVMPFEKRYYSGGANSVRAWSVRTLGPGSYKPDINTTFYEQSGDIKLDLNIEYRSRFFWKFEAAAFLDAGNVWTLKAYEGQEGGEFKFNKFYKEIALGYGLGLRLNFDYFLIRLDGGWKAYDPEKTGKEKWAVLKPNFTNNFAWHFAVGYPF